MLSPLFNFHDRRKMKLNDKLLHVDECKHRIKPWSELKTILWRWKKSCESFLVSIVVKCKTDIDRMMDIQVLL